MTQNALQDNGDKKFAILGLDEQLLDIGATQVAMNVEAFVQKQLNEILTIRLQNGQLEYVVLDLDGFVVVTLEDLGQGQLRTIPVECQTQISFQLCLALFLR